MGGDKQASANYGIGPISIHAPAWGATNEHIYNAVTALISIHAPAWGATACYVVAFSSKQFQFTPPRGGRHYWQATVGSGTTISIHAPAWGATQRNAQLQAESIFQFTPPRGGRPHFGIMYPAVKYFNSRPRVGGDNPAG